MWRLDFGGGAFGGPRVHCGVANVLVAQKETELLFGRKVEDRVCNLSELIANTPATRLNWEQTIEIAFHFPGGNRPPLKSSQGDNRAEYDLESLLRTGRRYRAISSAEVL